MFRADPIPAAAIVVNLSVFGLLLLAGCSNNGDPFSYVKVSGKATYQDGTLIPAPKIMLSFLPQTEAVGKAHPHLAWALVDTNTGEFRNVTTHTPHDGLVRGKHKVQITGPDHAPLPTSLVPAEYADFKNTPLEVDTDHLPFEIKVSKPASGSGEGARR
ncbi:MAG: hypothetical protein ABSG53_18610 [Thermoguttaceae bacterium]